MAFVVQHRLFGRERMQLAVGNVFLARQHLGLHRLGHLAAKVAHADHAVPDTTPHAAAGPGAVQYGLGACGVVAAPLVGDSNDPVTVRTLVCDGVRYLYLVNREGYPVRAMIHFQKEKGPAVELASGKKFKLSPIREIRLAPYELRSFTLPATTDIVRHTNSIPGDIEQALMARTEKALQQVQHLQSRNLALPVGTEQLLPKIREAMNKKRYAWLRHALDSYAMRMCAALAEEIK
ncbi:MAG: hypothetical protein BWY83_00262 [bacterium ADurb.Bin478]|nr:MAG: hypothetical protein BWY83_00262 [bacterium ADurb.Bin478]